MFEAVIRPGVVLRWFLPCWQKKRSTVVDDSCFDPEVSPEQTTDMHAGRVSRVLTHVSLTKRAFNIVVVRLLAHIP